MARTRQASGGTAAEPPELHVRRPNLSLDDLLRFVIKPLHVTLGGLIGCLRRFQGGSCTLYLLVAVREGWPSRIHAVVPAEPRRPRASFDPRAELPPWRHLSETAGHSCPSRWNVAHNSGLGLICRVFRQSLVTMLTL